MTAQTRRIDPATVRKSLASQWRAHVEFAGGLNADQLAAPSVLEGWTTELLVRHVALSAMLVTMWGVRPAEAVDGDVATWTAKAESAAADIDGATRSLPWDDDSLANAFAAAESTMDAMADEELITVNIGGIKLADFLVTRVIEAVVHADDLGRSTGVAFPHDEEALAVAVQALANSFADRVPGDAVELRVAPHVVVMCVADRAASPQVVEMDPATWMRLATGRITWDEAENAGQVPASVLGEHLPLMR
jgi:uncharacterized protein (TIGR03083 family)